MRLIESPSHILPFRSRHYSHHARMVRPVVGPLSRIELHQVEHDEISQLRERLLTLILDREQSRKTARLRLVN